MKKVSIQNKLMFDYGQEARSCNSIPQAFYLYSEKFVTSNLKCVYSGTFFFFSYIWYLVN